MNRSIFICSVCGSPLRQDETSYRCTNNHNYDIAREGYVNLLLANQKQSRDPGDSREMLEARKSFLSKGYYKPLARSLASLIIRHKRRSHDVPLQEKISYCQRRILKCSVTAANYCGKHSGKLTNKTFSVYGSDSGTGTAEHPAADDAAMRDFTILDAGCGEGYYTDYISKNHYINNSSAIYGIDISRDGIKSASKRNSGVKFAVAGIYNLPVQDCSADTILNIFAPFNEEEFSRVLKDDGIIISVTPGAHHLYEFKQNLYDEVYLNDEKSELSDKFHTAETMRVKYELNIHNGSDIANLLKMTPYYHKSSPERIDAFIKTVNELKTTADFLIRVLKKN